MELNILIVVETCFFRDTQRSDMLRLDYHDDRI